MAWFWQSGQERLVSKLIESWRSGSIHMDVPVYPRCPKERSEKYFPDCEGAEGVSQPSAREVPSGADSRREKSSMVEERRIGYPPLSTEWAKMAKSSAVENKPACPAMPPRTLAFSSCTSPWMMRWRKVRSSAVGGMESLNADAGLNVVCVMPSGPKISRWQDTSRDSSARRSRTTPRMMKPMSLYSARPPGAAASGVVN